MRRTALSMLLLFQVSAAAPARVFAQEAPREVSVPGTEVHEFRAANGTLFDLYVALPEGYVADGSVEYPVFYSTDASMGFAASVQIYRFMAMGDEQPALPPMILVGVDRARSSGVNSWRDAEPSISRRHPLRSTKLARHPISGCP